MEVSERDLEKRVEMANGLRELADIIENYGGDEIPLPWGIHVHINVSVSEYKQNEETGEWGTVYDTEATLAKIHRGLSVLRGKKIKNFTDYEFSIKKELGGNVTLELSAARASVCKRVETGETKVVPAHYSPERVEKVYEYVCEDTVILASVPKEA